VEYNTHIERLMLNRDTCCLSICMKEQKKE
jgi:hypothetical protein